MVNRSFPAPSCLIKKYSLHKRGRAGARERVYPAHFTIHNTLHKFVNVFVLLLCSVVTLLSGERCLNASRSLISERWFA